MKKFATWIAVIGVLILAGCAPTIAVPVAEYADNPACAIVLARTPSTMDGHPQRRTTSQASTAWGNAGAAITMRCGVEQPGPSADCLSITYGDVTVDWISQETTTGWRFTTYGREPAVEVAVPSSLGLSQPGLTDLTDALANTVVTAQCE